MTTTTKHGRGLHTTRSLLLQSHKITRSRGVARSRKIETKQIRYSPATTKPIGIKLDKVVSYNKASPHTKSSNPLNMWSHEVTW